MRRRLLPAAVLSSVLAVAACGGSAPSTAPGSSAAPTVTTAEAARHFLSSYVTGDGRVLRRDQGGDVVSEGQAYGMLVAQLADDPDAVRTIWAWTADHLRRDDGLLAFHADARGKVLDRSAATDADVLAAYALLRYDGPDAAALHRDGSALARAVLAHETVSIGPGRPVPVAGDWATAGDRVANPSYWMPGVFAALAHLTDDPRWGRAATTTVALLDAATDGGRRLPTDWGRLVDDALQPTGSPDGGTSEQYGPDAQRLPLWFAAGCDDAAKRLAAAWDAVLAGNDRAAALALDPDGSVRAGTPTPLALLAAAAAARAAGDEGRAADLTARGAQQATRAPTYYGDAWVALAAGLADGSLVDC